VITDASLAAVTKRSLYKDLFIDRAITVIIDPVALLCHRFSDLDASERPHSTVE
jgi:hypothetical protein